jgi:hypothetical protein
VGFKPANRPPTIERLEAGATGVVTVGASQRLRHTICSTDETTPTRRAKPAGVIGAEIWVKVDGPPPVELEFLAVDTRAPLHARLRRRAGQQDRALHAALGQLARRGRAVECNGHGDDWCVGPRGASHL